MRGKVNTLILEGLLAVLLLAGALYNYAVNNLITPLDVVFVGIAVVSGADVVPYYVERVRCRVVKGEVSQ